MKVIASNDSHYIDQSDFNAHDILFCINTGEKQSTPALREFYRRRYSRKEQTLAFPNDQFYFKKTEEMAKVFEDLPEAIDNTNEIVDKVELLDLKRDILLPHFMVPANYKSQDEYLRALPGRALRNVIRYSPETEERIKFELG